MSMLQIGDGQVPYTVRVSPGSRHVRLKLRPNFELEVFGASGIRGSMSGQC